MALARPFARRTRAIPRDHGRGAPAALVLEVRVGEAAQLGVVRPRMAEPVQVEVAEARLGGAPFQGLPDPVLGERTLEPEPEVGRPRGIVPAAAGTQVAVDGLGGLDPHRDPADAASLAQHGDLSQLGIHVLGRQAGDLGPAEAAIEEEPDEGGVAAVLEGRATAGFLERPELRHGQRVDGGDFDRGRLGAGHRGDCKLAVTDGPREERAEGAVAVGRGRRLPLGKECGHESLDVGARDRACGARMPGCLKMGAEEMDGFAVGLDGARGLVFGAQAQGVAFPERGNRGGLPYTTDAFRGGHSVVLSGSGNPRSYRLSERCCCYRGRDPDQAEVLTDL